MAMGYLSPIRILRGGLRGYCRYISAESCTHPLSWNEKVDVIVGKKLTGFRMVDLNSMMVRGTEHPEKDTLRGAKRVQANIYYKRLGFRLMAVIAPPDKSGGFVGIQAAGTVRRYDPDNDTPFMGVGVFICDDKKKESHEIIDSFLLQAGGFRLSQPVEKDKP